MIQNDELQSGSATSELRTFRFSAQGKVHRPDCKHCKNGELVELTATEFANMEHCLNCLWGATSEWQKRCLVKQVEYWEWNTDNDIVGTCRRCGSGPGETDDTCPQCTPK